MHRFVQVTLIGHGPVAEHGIDANVHGLAIRVCCARLLFGDYMTLSDMLLELVRC